MGAYFITISLCLAFAGLAEYGKHHTLQREGTALGVKVLLAISVGVLIFTGGLRYHIGTDFGAYYNGLETYGSALKDSLKKLDEPGLPIIASVVKLFTNDGAYFIFVCFMLTMILFAVPTLKYTDSYLFVMALFIFTGTWHGPFNGVRQFLAAAILFAGHRLILERKFWKYLLVVLLATLVHKSAAIGIVFYFLFANRLNIRNVIILLLGMVLVSRHYEELFQLIGFVKETEMSIDQYSYYSTSVNIFRVLVSCAPAVYVLILYARKNPDKEKTFYINALLANAAAMLATANSAYLARFNIYTNTFTALALAKLIKFDNNKAQESIIRAGIVVLYGIFWYLQISGSNSLSPFHWVWQR